MHFKVSADAIIVWKTVDLDDFCFIAKKIESIKF